MAGNGQCGRDLIEAVMSHDLKKVKTELRQGANLDYIVRGDMAIHLAARSGDKDIISVLLRAGDSVNKGNMNGNTPLHFIARDGREDLVDYLLKKGADINIQNEDGDTPLHSSVGYQPMDVIENYVNKGMDVNKQNKNGDTPLHMAVYFSRDESVEALLLSKADVNVTNNQGKKAYEVANRESIAEFIKTYALMATAMESGYIMAEGTKLRYRDIERSKYLQRVGITLDSMSLDKQSLAVFYCRREKYENNSVSFTTEPEEEVISDVYHFRIRDVIDELKTTFRIPVYAEPSDKQQIEVKFIAGEGGTQILTDQQKEDENIFCMVNVVLVPETTSVVVVCLCVKAQNEAIGEHAQVISSELEDNFTIEIPEGAFQPDTKMSFKVFDVGEGATETDNEDGDSKSVLGTDTRDTSQIDSNNDASVVLAKDEDEDTGEKENIQADRKLRKRRAKRKLLSDVFQINISGEQPSKSVKMQLPITDINDNLTASDLKVVRMNDSNSKEVEVLEGEVVMEGNNVTFATEHFSTFVLCPVKVCRDLAKIVTEIQNSKHRRQEGRFFAMVRVLDDEVTQVLVVECIKANQSSKRRKYWKGKGFGKQKPKHSSRMMLTPSQEYSIEISGDAKFDEDNGETGQRKLVFSPHRACFQPYQVTLPMFYKDGKAAVHIYTTEEDSEEINDEPDLGPLAEPKKKIEVAKLKIKLQLPPIEDPFGPDVEDALTYETEGSKRRRKLRFVWSTMYRRLRLKNKDAFIKSQLKKQHLKELREKKDQAEKEERARKNRIDSEELKKKRSKYPLDILSGSMKGTD